MAMGNFALHQDAGDAVLLHRGGATYSGAIVDLGAAAPSRFHWWIVRQEFDGAECVIATSWQILPPRPCATEEAAQAQQSKALRVWTSLFTDPAPEE